MVLICGALSSNAALHELIHPDAHSGHHHCAITIFAHGQVDVADATPLLAAPAFRDFPQTGFVQRVAIISRDYLLLPGRAPPVLPA